MPCIAPDCKRVVSEEDAEKEPWRCAPCTRKMVKRERDAIYASVPMWWTSRGMCTACGNEYTVACPVCHATGKLPVVPELEVP